MDEYMADRFWAMYTRLKHKEQYFNFFNTRVKLINGVKTGACFVVSVASAGLLSILSFAPSLWMLLICLAQIIEALSPLYPFTRQINGLEFLLPELNDLLLEIDGDWMKINTYSADELIDLVAKYERRYNNLIHKYLSGAFLPDGNKKCELKAKAACKNYFSNYYNANEVIENVQ